MLDAMSVGMTKIQQIQYNTDNYQKAGAHMQDAQLHVWKFGSKQYKSHRRVPERVAQQYDQ
jgi:hypothetical protein